MIILLILIALLISYILFKVIKDALWVIRAMNMTSNIPGPKPLPILGNLLHFWNVKTSQVFFQKSVSLLNEYRHPEDKILKFWFGSKLVVALMDPQHIETVFTSENATNKDSIYDYLSFSATGAFVKNGKEWEELRKPMNHFFTKKWIEPQLDMYHDKSMKVIKLIDEEVEDDRVFDVKHFVSKLSLSIYLSSQGDYEWDGLYNKRTDNVPEIIECIINTLVQAALAVPYNMTFWTTQWSSSGRRIHKLSSVVWRLVHQVFKARRTNSINLNGKTTKENYNYMDFLAEKAKKNNLSWDETGKLTTDFLIAGSHSISVMISCAIVMLAMHPEYQEAVYKEQLEIMGEDPDIAPTWEQLSRMTYLTRVFKEITRLHTGAFVLRKVSKDIDLGKYQIPEGSTTLLGIYATHRDPKYWSHPEKFYPDHFLPEEISERPKNAFVPFGFGSRTCPGALFASTTFKVAISTLIRRYLFKTELKMEDLMYQFLLFVDISNGHFVRKIPRRSINYNLNS